MCDGVMVWWCDGVQVKEAEELEQAQRVTQEKKHAVHDELVRKAKAQEVCDKHHPDTE